MGNKTMTKFSIPKKIKKSDSEWRALLGDQRYHVLRERGTERAFTSKLNDEKRKGVFHCAGCKLALFSSSTKFDSGTCCPSFWDHIDGSIETKVTQSSESNGDNQNAIATTSTTTTTDGGSIQESRKLEYTQARVGMILKLKDEETGLLVWTHSYWYSGIELSSTAQICARNSVRLISKLFSN